MKGKLIFVFALVFMTSTTMVFSKDSDESKTSVAYADLMNGTDQLTAENLDLIIQRVDEIREMDRSELTAEVRYELKNELRNIKDLIQNQAPYLYIGGGTLLLIIILLILLL